LERLGVKTLNLFGSVVRGEARLDSDADFLVKFSIETSLFDLFRVQHYLEDLLNRKVDLSTEDALREYLRESVVRDLIRGFQSMATAGTGYSRYERLAFNGLLMQRSTKL
jgi:predicted nucleotidyltransferase